MILARSNKFYFLDLETQSLTSCFLQLLPLVRHMDYWMALLYLASPICSGNHAVNVAIVRVLLCVADLMVGIEWYKQSQNPRSSDSDSTSWLA